MCGCVGRGFADVWGRDVLIFMLSYFSTDVHVYRTPLELSGLQVYMFSESLALYSLIPRCSRRRRNAWYTLFVHAFNFRDISENRILSVIFRVIVTFRPTPTKTYLLAHNM